MKLADFKVGGTYRIYTREWTAPNGDKVPAKTMIREILEPASRENSAFEDGPATDEVIGQWKEFLRVRSPGTRQIHLLHPETIMSAETLS